MLHNPKAQKMVIYYQKILQIMRLHIFMNKKIHGRINHSFLYLSYGSTHTPHHAPKKYIDKYKGAFDEGWDVLREKWFHRQKDLGVIPEDAELTERAEYVPAWDSLDTDRKNYMQGIWRLMPEWWSIQMHR